MATVTDVEQLPAVVRNTHASKVYTHITTIHPPPAPPPKGGHEELLREVRLDLGIYAGCSSAMALLCTTTGACTETMALGSFDRRQSAVSIMTGLQLVQNKDTTALGMIKKSSWLIQGPLCLKPT